MNGLRLALFSAPLHLRRLSLHHDSTLFCCGGFCQSCGKIRLNHFGQSDDSFAVSSSVVVTEDSYAMHRAHLQSASVIATCNVASSLRTVCNLSILTFEPRAVPAVLHVTQRLNSSSSVILLLGTTFRELLVAELLGHWHPLTPFEQTQSDRSRIRSRPSWTSGVATILRIHLHIS